MIRAHLRRSIGGGLGGPLRSLPQGIGCAREPDHSTLGRANPHSLLASRRGNVPLSSAGFAGATNPGGRFRKGGEAPLRVERTGSTPRVRPSGAALQLDPSHRSSQGSLRQARRLVFGVAMFLQGCAGLIPGREGATGPAEISRGEGSFQVRRGRPGIVIGAPHGTSDKGTDIIARDLAGLTGFSLVLATGFSHLGSDGFFLNDTATTES